MYTYNKNIYIYIYNLLFDCHTATFGFGLFSGRSFSLLPLTHPFWTYHKVLVYQAQKGCMQEHLFDHFKGEGHSGLIGNVSVTHIN